MNNNETNPLREERALAEKILSRGMKWFRYKDLLEDAAKDIKKYLQSQSLPAVEQPEKAICAQSDASKSFDAKKKKGVYEVEFDKEFPLKYVSQQPSQLEGKTLEEICDDTAKRFNCHSWNDLEDFQKLVLYPIICREIYEANQPRKEWINARNDHPVIPDDFESLEVLADTGDYNNYEVVVFDGTDYLDKHRNNYEGNPLEITDSIIRWKYI